ncbi:hypothetical protein [Virgibacillus saliphilus]|uniref:hypothetical protein n=1 Tax=Virgibacillus saliphilus TaxID=2831674 RepID=UPI00210716F8|nr:hypothetical protein [Virgibacillus sp. NKC19-3]
MKRFYKWGLVTSIFSFTLLHFFTYFYEKTFLLDLLAISGVGLFVFSILIYTPKKIKMPLSLFLVGLIILLFSNAPFFVGLVNGVLQMRNMIGLIVVIPMIGWVLRGEPYLEAIMAAAHKLIGTSRKFYFSIVSLTQIIAYFLMFGAIPMMHQLENWLLKDEKGEPWEHFKGTAVLRGFSLSVMWVITIPSFAFVVEIMGASLSISIFQGLMISIVGIIVALIFSKYEERKYGVDLTAGLQEEIDDVLRHSESKKVTNRLVKEFIFLFTSLFGLIFLLYATVDVELLILIPLVVMVWIVTYYVVKRRLNKLAAEAKSYAQNDTIPQAYQLCVMLGAGMLIYGLTQTSFVDLMVNGLYSFQESLPYINVLHILPFMVILLGFFGLGPLTVMVLVGGYWSLYIFHIHLN